MLVVSYFCSSDLSSVCMPRKCCRVADHCAFCFSLCLTHHCRSSRLLIVRCSLFVSMAGTGDELQRAQADSSRQPRGEKREKRAYHAPWETTPVHCLDLDSGSSNVDDMSLEAFWKYLAKPANTVVWKSECPCNHGGVLCVHCFAGLRATTSASAWP